MDTATAEFMDIIDCSEWEVREMAADRRYVEDRTAVTPERRHEALGSFVLWFGKHKGQALRDVPRSYLQWLVNQSDRRPRGMPPKIWKSLGKAKRRIQEYLNCGGIGALDQDAEFRAIVRGS